MRITAPLEHFFRISERGSTIRRECLAGLTTFMTMSYIVFANTAIMSTTGMPAPAIMSATIYAAALGSLLMGLLVNVPVAMAPGMGINAYFSFFLCAEIGLSWQDALGLTFVSGLLFFLLMISGFGQRLVQGMPTFLRHAVAVGVGFFIATVGMKSAGLVVAHPTTFVAPGNVSDPGTVLCLLGLILVSVLLVLRIHGAMLYGMALVTLLAMSLGITPLPHAWTDVICIHPPGLGETFGQMRFDRIWKLSLIPPLVSFSLTCFFNNVGTLIGLSGCYGRRWNAAEDRLLARQLTLSAAGIPIAAVMGTAGVTPYIENAAGISEGGRTGFAAVVTACLFLLTLFFHPLLSMVPSLATAPSVILVGIFMMQEAKHINFGEFSEALPACVTITFMAISFSIFTGLSLGYLTYITVKIVTGKLEEITLPHLILAVLILMGMALG